MVLETDATGTPIASYILADTRLISQQRDGATSYYLPDGQGSVRVSANSTGKITNTYAYTALGELYTQTGTTANSYLYTGQQFDTLTGAVAQFSSIIAILIRPSTGSFSLDHLDHFLGSPAGLVIWAERKTIKG